MSLLSGAERIRVLYLREDYKVENTTLPVEAYASDVITKKKNEKRDKSWLLPHGLLKTCYNLPGIPDGKKVLIICPRDVRFDPLNQLNDSWSKGQVRLKMGEIAREQQHKADSHKNSGPMNVTMVLLAASAFVLFLSIAAVGILNYYKG